MIKNIYGITELNTKIKIGEYEVPDLVGGVIFYIDPNSDEVVEFYDAQGNVISNVSVGDSPAAYKIVNQGTSGKDKYYIYNPSQSEFDSVLEWAVGGDHNVTGASGLDIGDGKSNTSIVLNIQGKELDGTIWEWIINHNTNKTGGCNDWYVGSKGEINQFVSYYTTVSSDSFSLWNSAEDTGYNASYYSRSEWSNTWYSVEKLNQRGCVLIRSF